MTLMRPSWWRDLKAYPALGKRLLGIVPHEEQADYSTTELTDLRNRIVHRLHPRRMQLVVDEIRHETGSTRTLRMTRTDGELPPFRPGQYVNLSVEIDGILTSRPYSISSRPGLPYLDLTVRETKGGFVSPYLVRKVKKNDLFESTGPRGTFRYEPLIDGPELIFIAGGSGITPVMSILRDAAERNWPFRARVIYGNRTTRDIIFRKELNRLAHGHGNLHIDYVISHPQPGFKGKTGLLTLPMLQKLLRNVEDKRFFICGPTKMYDLVFDGLRHMGVKNYQVRREVYGPCGDITSDPAWPVGLQPDAERFIELVGRETFPAPAGEPVLNSLERHGYVLPAICRSGECGACRVQLLNGKVLIPQNTGIREADRMSGYIHACAAYPVENIVVKLP